MLHDYVEKQMLAHFSFVPTDDQKVAFKELAKFITSDAEVFIMNGYAGTGKTTLVRSLIETLMALETDVRLNCSRTTQKALRLQFTRKFTVNVAYTTESNRLE